MNNNEPCKNCNGEGLVGQGPTPHLKVGRIETCPACNGTGKVPILPAGAGRTNEEARAAAVANGSAESPKAPGADTGEASGTPSEAAPDDVKEAVPSN